MKLFLALFLLPTLAFSQQFLRDDEGRMYIPQSREHYTLINGSCYMRTYTDHVEEPEYNGKQDIKSCSKSTETYEIGLKGECFEVNKSTGKKIKTHAQFCQFDEGKFVWGKVNELCYLVDSQTKGIIFKLLVEKKDCSNTKEVAVSNVGRSTIKETSQSGQQKVMHRQPGTTNQ